MFAVSLAAPPALRKAPADQKGVALALLIIIVAVLAVAAAGAAGAFLLLRGETHPPEQTAGLLPFDTQVYFSLNLRPGNDQLGKLQDILERFREHPGLQPKIDDLFESADDETGIDPERDIFTWLGPEVAVAFIDVTGSAVATATGGTPLLVALVGTTDPEQSLGVLQRWMDYLRVAAGLDFETDSHRDISVFKANDEDQHYAVAGAYVLFATDRDLLEDTIDRIVDGDATGSLLTNPRFNAAREALPEQRFASLYVDTSAIWKDVSRQFLGGELTRDLRGQIDEVVPEWAAMAGSFIDRGIELTASAPTPDAAAAPPPHASSLASARLLPAGTLAYLSFAFDPNLDGLREQLSEQSVASLGPEVGSALSLGLGLDIHEEATLGDLLDQLLGVLRDATGVDLERDVLDPITGEVSLALLPTDFSAMAADPLAAAIKAAVFLQFDAQKRDKLAGAIDDLLNLLEGALPLRREAVTYGDGEGAVYDLSGMAGTTAYRPGYLLLGEHLVVATTAEILESVASIEGSTRVALVEEPEYARLVGRLSGTRSPLVFVNIRRLREVVVAALDPNGRREYQENVEPFVEPLRALLAAGDTREGLSRATLVITIE